MIRNSQPYNDTEVRMQIVQKHVRHTACAHYFLAGVLAVFFALLAAAQAPAQAVQPAKVYAPGEIHPGSSRIYVYVAKTGMGHEHAVVGLLKEGVIHLGAVQNAGYVVADLTSLVADPDLARKYLGLAGTTDADTQKKVTANMLGPDVLDVQKFATASVKIASARLLPNLSPRGLPQYSLEGELTFHGVTRKMQVVADAEEKDGWIRLRGQAPLVQTEFGITPYRIALGVVGVSDQLELYGDAYIAKENKAEAR